MNEEALNERMNELNAMEQQIIVDVNKLQANLNAVAGTKQDVQYWLDKLTADESPKPEIEQLDAEFIPMQETAHG